MASQWTLGWPSLSQLSGVVALRKRYRNHPRSQSDVVDNDCAEVDAFRLGAPALTPDAA